MANASMGGAMAAAIARAIGAGRKDDAAALVIHALVIACAAGALFSALFLLAGPLIYGLLGGHGAVLAAALDYSGAIFAGARDLLAARRAHQRGARDRARRPAGLCLPRRGGAALRPGAVAGVRRRPDPRARRRRRRHRHHHVVRRLEPGAGLLPRLRPFERDAVVPRRAASARDVRRDPEGRRADVDAAAVQQHRACGDHRLCRPARHHGAGRLRHRRAAGVPALSDQLRAWRRRARHGRHQHRRPPV